MSYVTCSRTLLYPLEDDTVTSVTDPITGRTITADTIINDREWIIASARQHLLKRMTKAMLDLERPALMFFTHMIKRIRFMESAAAIVWEPIGCRLDVDPVFALAATDDQLEFVLCHELLHITNSHATRLAEICENYGVPLAGTSQRIGWLLDLPINEMLKPFARGCGIDEKSMCTYETTGTPDNLLTIEQLFAYVLNLMPKPPRIYIRISVPMSGNDKGDDGDEGQSGSQGSQGKPKPGGSGQGKPEPGSGDSDEENEDGSGNGEDPNENGDEDSTGEGNDSNDESENGSGKDDPSNGNQDKGDGGEADGDSGNGNGEAPYPDPRGDSQDLPPMSVALPSKVTTDRAEKNLKAIAQQIAKQLENRSKTAGTIGALILEHISLLSNSATKDIADNVIKYLETALRMTARRSRTRHRTISRISRLTGLPPGKRKHLSYSLMYHIDESGSMNDWEVGAAFEIVRRNSMSRKNDKIYVCHWDTEPAAEITEISSRHDIKKLNRQRSGGTVFTNMFSHKKVMAKKVDARVIITDGEVYDWPNPKSKEPEIWIITTPGGYENWKNQYGHGLAFDVSGKLRDAMNE